MITLSWEQCEGSETVSNDTLRGLMVRAAELHGSRPVLVGSHDSMSFEELARALDNAEGTCRSSPGTGIRGARTGWRPGDAELPGCHARAAGVGALVAGAGVGSWPATRQGAVVRSARAMAQQCSIGPDDVIEVGVAIVEPLGFGMLLVALASGATVSLRPSPDTTVMVLDQAALVRGLGVGSTDRRASKLRWALSSPRASTSLAEAFRRHYGVPLRHVFQTGGAFVAADLGAEPTVAGGSVGDPLEFSGLIVDVVDRQGTRCPPGRSGDLVVHLGEQCPCGSGGRRVAPVADARVDGDRACTDWVPSGQVARFEPCGRLHVLGARPGARNAAGRPVDGELIEQVISAASGVRDVAVVEQLIGRDRMIRAIVEVEPGCDRPALVAWCRRHLPEDAVPALFELHAARGAPRFVETRTLGASR